MKYALYRILRITNFFFLTLLLLAQMATELPPSILWWPSFLGLAYPFIYLINAGFVLFWIWRRKWAVLISLPILALNYNLITPHFQLFQKSKDTATQLKLMSYNVRMFDLYNWSGSKFTSNKLHNFLAEQNPDILLFQEYYSKEKQAFNNTKRILSNLEYPYYQTEETPARKQHHGLAIFSRFPVHHIHYLKTNNKSFAQIADVYTPTDTLRIINVHLQSVGFNQTNYQFIDSISLQNTEETAEGMLTISRKLKQGFEKRVSQTKQIIQAIAHSPYPVIVNGDFNDTPGSYTYYQIRKGLHDAFMQSGSGMGASYRRLYMPLRIDYFLGSPPIKFSGFHTHSVDYSDHRPISCYISLPVRTPIANDTLSSN